MSVVLVSGGVVTSEDTMNECCTGEWGGSEDTMNECCTGEWGVVRTQ